MDAARQNLEFARAMIRRHGVRAAFQAREAERRMIRLGRSDAAVHWNGIEATIMALRVERRLEQLRQGNA